MKLKSILKKVLVAGTIATMTLLATSVVFAADGTSKTGPTVEGTKTTTKYIFTGSGTSTVNPGTTLDCGIYIKEKTVKKNGSDLQIKGTIYVPIAAETNSVKVSITPNGEKDDRIAIVGKSAMLPMVTGSSVDIKLLEDEDCDTVKGQRYLKFDTSTTGADFKVKDITVVEDSASVTTYSVSGKITNNSSYEDATVSFSTSYRVKEATASADGSYSVTNLVAGEKYDIVCSNELVDLSVTSITPSKNETAFDIVLTDKKITTLSGTVDTNLAKTGNITVTGTDFSKDVVIDGGKYSVIVPQSDTYTFSLDSNSEYIESQYVIENDKVTVGTEKTKEFNITGVELNEWNFETLPSKKFEGSSTGNGTYKGIIVSASASGCKFEPKSGGAQFNKNTTIKVPIDTNEKIIIKTTKHLSTISYDEAGYATVKADANDTDYIVTIKIVAKNAIETDNVKNGAVYTDGADSYIIAKVTENDMDKDSLTIMGKAASDKDVTTDTVYKAVQIGDVTINAEDIEGATYIFAVKVEEAQGRDAVNLFNVKFA